MSYKNDSFCCDNCKDELFAFEECERCGKMLCQSCYDYNLGYCDDCKDYLAKEKKEIDEEMWRDFFSSRF